MNSALRVDTAETRGQTTALALTGELDLNTATDLYRAVKDALSAYPTTILDLTGVTFCDSSGLNTLIRLRSRARAAGGRLVLAAPPRQMLRLLTVTGAGSSFPLYGSTAEAWQDNSPTEPPPR